MNWFSLLLGLACATRLLAAPATQASSAEEQRYLFIVDTSSSMRSLARESRQAIFDLVYWGIDGHMRAGDTYGIWAVDEELHAGEFPMQVWRAEQQLDLATKASLHLKDQRYRKNANYGKLSISLLALVMDVKDVNLFLITDAEDPLVGLPMAQQIQHACAARSKERAAQRKPFVIYLNGSGGEIRSAAVAIAGETFRMPERKRKPESARSRSVVPTAATDPKPAGRTVSLGYVDPEGIDDRAAAAAAMSHPQSSAPARSPAPSKETMAVVNAEKARTAPIPSSEAESVVKAELARTTRIQPTESAAVLEAERTRATAFAQTRRGAPPLEAVQPPLIPAVQSPVQQDVGALAVAAREPRPVPVAMAAPVMMEPLMSARELFIVSGVLLLVAIGLIFAFLRRIPRAAHGSYISKSMDDHPR